MRTPTRGNFLLRDVIDDGPNRKKGCNAHGTAYFRDETVIAPPPSSLEVAVLHQSRNVDALCDATIPQLEELFRLADPGVWRDAVRAEYATRFVECDQAERRRKAAKAAKLRAAAKYRKRNREKMAQYQRDHRAKMKAQAQ